MPIRKKYDNLNGSHKQDSATLPSESLTDKDNPTKNLLLRQVKITKLVQD